MLTRKSSLMSARSSASIRSIDRPALGCGDKTRAGRLINPVLPSSRSTTSAIACQKLPTDDCFGTGVICADGRKTHPAYLSQVKTLEDVHRRGNVYQLTYTTPAARRSGRLRKAVAR